MSDAFTLPVISVSEIGSRQVLLSLDATGTPVAASHTVAGQYVKLGLYSDDVPRPFALANKPGAGILEFIIKAPPERLARILALRAGDRVSVSTSQGTGYPMDKLRGNHVWLIGNGSGIAPLRSLLEVILDERSAYLDVHLFYGARTPGELAFRSRFGTWSGLGVRVMPTVSQPGDEPWEGARGYVQAHLPATLPSPSRTRVVICGLPDMERVVGAALLERGVGPDQVFRNW